MSSKVAGHLYGYSETYIRLSRDLLSLCKQRNKKNQLERRNKGVKYKGDSKTVLDHPSQVMCSLPLFHTHTHTLTHTYIYHFHRLPVPLFSLLPASAWPPPVLPDKQTSHRTSQGSYRHAKFEAVSNNSARSMGDVHPARVISRPAAEARPPSAAIAEPIRSVNWLTVVQFSFPAPLGPEIGISRHKTRSNRKEKKPEEGVSCVCRVMIISSCVVPSSTGD